MKTWLIVGASRGIGREFLTKLSQTSPPSKVLATARKPAPLTASTSSLPNPPAIFTLDVTSSQSIDAAVADIRKHVEKIDYVVLNAGVLLYPNRASEMSFETFEMHLRTNAVGPVMVAQALLRAGVEIVRRTYPFCLYHRMPSSFRLSVMMF